MTNIEEIAKRIWSDVSKSSSVGESIAVKFAHALLAEPSKDVEPSAWFCPKTGFTTISRRAMEQWTKDGYSMQPLFTNPANIAEIEQDATASCLCCGKVGEPASWLADNKNIYVCTRCHRLGNTPEFKASTEEEGDAFAHGYFENHKDQVEIEQRVAEACAKVYLNTYDLSDIAEDVRAGKWREFL